MICCRSKSIHLFTRCIRTTEVPKSTWTRRIASVRRTRMPQRHRQQTTRFRIFSIPWAPVWMSYKMRIDKGRHNRVSTRLPLRWRCFDLFLLPYIYFSIDDFDSNQPKTNHSIFSIEFYQKFFNVDASVVYERIMSAIVPRRAPVQYMKQDIASNPDLYGPFWIVVTLVRFFSIENDISVSNLLLTHKISYLSVFF